jgi:hypothetical protein
VATLVELQPEKFFASRVGVCVYVVVSGQTFRVQFEAPDAHGAVETGAGQDARAALEIARRTKTPRGAYASLRDCRALASRGARRPDLFRAAP